VRQPRAALLFVALPCVALSLAPLLGGCGKEDTDDEDDEVEDTGDADPTPDTQPDCEEIELDIIGPAEPAVGDTWTLWLRCDGATLAGTMVLRFEPPDFADIESNNATFRSAGDATMLFQVGSRRVEHEVTVAP
jgi:hypothetical protein